MNTENSIEDFRHCYPSLAGLFRGNDSPLRAAVRLYEKGAEARKLEWRLRRLQEVAHRRSSAGGEKIRRRLQQLLKAAEHVDVPVWMRDGLRRVLAECKAQLLSPSKRRRLAEVYLNVLLDYVHQCTGKNCDKEIADLLNFDTPLRELSGTGKWTADALRKRRARERNLARAGKRKHGLVRARPRVRVLGVLWEKDGREPTWKDLQKAGLMPRPQKPAHPKK